MKSESLKIKLEGHEHQVDANTLINTLIHYQNIISEANAIIGEGNYKINLKVNAIEKGSFVIDIELMGSFVKNLFNPENVTYISSLVTIVGGVYTAYKRFKGSPIKEDTKSEINISKDVNINIGVINVYNSPTIREAISKSIETAQADPNVEGIKIQHDNETFVNFERTEFSELIYNDFADEVSKPDEKIEIDYNAILSIITLSFEQSAKWQVMYNGFKISLPVKDNNLQKLIDSGERFAKGDAIKVKLEILKKYNESFNAYENKSYRILEFLSHIERNKQEKMNFS